MAHRQSKFEIKYLELLDFLHFLVIIHVEERLQGFILSHILGKQIKPKRVFLGKFQSLEILLN
jgi:hypothetical protein